jgi:hypothetical protein
MKEPGSASRGQVPDVAHSAMDVPYNTYLDQLDPRGDSEKSLAVRLALAQTTDTRFHHFLERLYLPHYRRYNLAGIAKTCGIGLAEFGEFWQKAQNVRAIAIVQDGIVEIAPDMVSDAHSRKVYCDRCDGTGWVFVDGVVPGMEFEQMGERKVRMCPACKGDKSISKPGDTDSRRMLLEMAGHTGKRGGVTVQIAQNFGGAGIESAVQKLAPISFDVEFEESQK